MEKEFVPYELAIGMKALGYTEPYFGWYDQSKLKKEYHPLKNSGSQEYMRIEDCTAPTFSQAFRWFREKGYRYTISFDSFMKNGMFYFEIWENGKCWFETDFDYNTYEEAELACLTKLIEIVEIRTK